MHGGNEARITRLTAVEANATYVPSAEIAGVEASPLATESGPSEARFTAELGSGLRRSHRKTCELAKSPGICPEFQSGVGFDELASDVKATNRPSSGTEGSRRPA